MPVVSELSPISLTQFFYESGKLVRPARLFFYKPDTEDRVTVYSDNNLQNAHDQPVMSGGSGRVPPIYVGTEPYRVRVFDSWGAHIEDIPWLPGASAAAGEGGGSVLTPEEREQLIQTGDYVIQFSNGALRAGFVRANGGWIGPTGFTGTGYTDIEMQNDDAYDLFVHLWGQDASAPNNVLEVLGGRGPDANSDWNSLAKMIRLPDLRGRALMGIDGLDMTPANRLTGVPLSPATGSQTKPGSYGGLATTIQTQAQLAAHAHTATAAVTGISIDSGGPAAGTTGGAAAALYDAGNLGTSHTVTGVSIAQSAHTHPVSDSGHSHTVPAWTAGPFGTTGGGGGFLYADVGTTHVASNVSVSGAIANVSISDGGHSHSTGAHNHAQELHYHTIPAATHTHTVTEPSGGTGHTHPVSTVGSSAAMPTTGPFSLATIYIKL